MEIVIKEEFLSEEIMAELIQLSILWESENNVYGYRQNQSSDIEGNRVFVAYDKDRIVGYLFGNSYPSKRASSIIEEDTVCFEIEELYVIPSYRSQSIGKMLMEYAIESVKDECTFITLSTATKNYKAILHFYIDEIGMEFWSARLYKRIKP